MGVREKPPAPASGEPGHNPGERAGIVILVLACFGIAVLAAAFSAGFSSGSGQTVAAAGAPVTPPVPPDVTAPVDPAATPAPSACRPLTITQTDGTEVSFP